MWLRLKRNGKFSQNGKFGQNGKLGHSCDRVTKGRPYDSRVKDHVFVHLGLNVSSSAHNCGCVVDGGNQYHVPLYAGRRSRAQYGEIIRVCTNTPT